jgi:predicted amidohydrolase
MKIALVQVASPDTESRDDRITRVEEILRTLGNVDLIVLPELWSTGYFHFEQYDELAETQDGPTITMCSKVAADLGVHIHLGSIVERTEDGKLKNTSMLIDPTGKIIHEFSKLHIFGYKSKEIDLLTAGDKLAVVATPFGNVVGTTCYDLRFPGLWMEISDRKADMVIVPAAWPATRREHWRLLTSARAVEHQIFVVAVNAVGTQTGSELGGYSRVVDPAGNVLGECGNSEQVLIVDLDPAQVVEVRKEFPVINDRLASYAGLAN